MPENTPQKDVKQFITWGLLALCCFLLAVILLFLYKNNQIGRYALHVENNETFSFYILDTKTSHVWYQDPHPGAHKVRCFDFGTIEKPTVEVSIIPEPNYDLSDFGGVRVQPQTDQSKYDLSKIVTAILYSKDTPSAIIDGKVLREGQSIRGVKVVKINQDSVEFETDGIRWSQKVNEQPSSFWP